MTDQSKLNGHDSKPDLQLPNILLRSDGLLGDQPEEGLEMAPRTNGELNELRDEFLKCQLSISQLTEVIIAREKATPPPSFSRGMSLGQFVAVIGLISAIGTILIVLMTFSNNRGARDQHIDDDMSELKKSNNQILDRLDHGMLQMDVTVHVDANGRAHADKPHQTFTIPPSGKLKQEGYAGSAGAETPADRR
jgi:hypothetical protein